MSTPTKDIVAEKLGDLTAEQLGEATRGLPLHTFRVAYTAGANSDSETCLDTRLERYMARGTKTGAHEHAYLDGNTYGDDPWYEYLRSRFEEPELYL